jgi:hypothetical protein
MKALTDERRALTDARWQEEDLDSAARTVRGFRLAVGLGAAIWVLLGVLYYGVTHV